MSILMKGSKPEEIIDVSNDVESSWINPYYALLNEEGVNTPLPIAVNNSNQEAVKWLRNWKKKNPGMVKGVLIASLNAGKWNDEPVGRYHEMLGYSPSTHGHYLSKVPTWNS